MRNIMPNWYSKKRTHEQRRTIYKFLRLMGFDLVTATRVRDWSNGHIRLFIASNAFCKLKTKK